MARKPPDKPTIESAASSPTAANPTVTGGILHFEHIQSVAKPVFLEPNYLTTISKHASDADLVAASEIRGKIISGNDLSGHYRSSTVPDDLLIGKGVMHLHLSSKASKALLYLVQFEYCVLFLRIWSHIYVDERPVGKSLTSDQMIAAFLARSKGGTP